MNDFKEWYNNHFEDCDYCLEVYESNRTEAEKSELIDKHTMDAFAGYADMVHDIAKDNYLER